MSWSLTWFVLEPFSISKSHSFRMSHSTSPKPRLTVMENSLPGIPRLLPLLACEESQCPVGASPDTSQIPYEPCPQKGLHVQMQPCHAAFDDYAHTSSRSNCLDAVTMLSPATTTTDFPPCSVHRGHHSILLSNLMVLRLSILYGGSKFGPHRMDCCCRVRG